MLNDGARVPVGVLFGNPASPEAVLTDGVPGAATSFFDAGLADLAGLFQIPLTF